MRFVKISQDEFSSILKLYESVMSYACHGLFYREGEAIASELIAICEREKDFLGCAKKILMARGWIEDATFNSNEVRIKGSIEVNTLNDSETCHRLRGILSRLLESVRKEPIRLTEVECCSMGNEECVFKEEVS